MCLCVPVYARVRVCHMIGVVTVCSVETVPDNKWLAHFTSVSNRYESVSECVCARMCDVCTLSLCLCRHILPLLTSLLNVVCSYDPVGYGVP